ncbi:uncharacterized protein LOC123661051 [Melitaea cinxia]|uniref:uncharacterized protein LOC123661051 n=1 Tax=Melitaea cinxia TaxID=113334 RepID=UPI001E26F518|nr:uncharacterized protein LOC123661051 [Melitaea cinxia]
MRVEIPECRRCCCCFPLRRGIIVLGYINLAISIFLVVIEIVISVKYGKTNYTVTLYKGLMFFSQVWFAYILFASEILFNIVLLVAAHTKKSRLLRAYYYYGITMTLATLVTFITLRTGDMFRNYGSYILESCFFFTNIGLQGYLILLVRSELLKMRRRSCTSYVNHAAEILVDTPEQTGRNPF